MQVSISGQKIQIGEALKEYVEEQLALNTTKYFEDAVSATVQFSKERHLFIAQVVVNEGTGNNVLIKAQGEASDIYAAFDTAVDRVAKQLRRYKRRIKNHHKRGNPKATGIKYVLASDGQEMPEEGESAPLIIAEKATEIEELSVSDAVMRMDLMDLPAVLFINRKTNSINVVYRRQDGNISWVDSGMASAAAAAS